MTGDILGFGSRVPGFVFLLCHFEHFAAWRELLIFDGALDEPSCFPILLKANR
jgi:hypothetical protein